MLAPELETIMAGKDDFARSMIAQRVGERLSTGDLSVIERQAAEALARVLLSDAVERVRCELSKSIRHAKHLPREIALKIAHDIDSVACPFLEVTEVFSESDWQRLVLTISRTSMVAVARRASISAGLAVTLAELGSLIVAETLVDNPAAPMTTLVCATLMNRFKFEASVFEKMAQRNDLIVEIVVKLANKVSHAAREKLLRCYKMAEHTALISAEAEAGTLLGIIRQTPPSGIPALVRTLRMEGNLSDILLLNAAGENLLHFLEAALSDRAAMRVEQVRTVLLQEGTRSVVELLKQARIPVALHEKFWSALVNARSKVEVPIQLTSRTTGNGS